MAPGQIVAYKRSWSDSLKGRGTQTAKTATRSLSVYSQSRERNNWERRLHDVDSIAYLRSKTVQPMGGSSIPIYNTNLHRVRVFCLWCY